MKVSIKLLGSIFTILLVLICLSGYSPRVIGNAFYLTTCNENNPVDWRSFTGSPAELCNGFEQVCAILDVPNSLLIPVGMPNAGKPNVAPGTTLGSIFAAAEAAITLNPYVDPKTGVKVYKDYPCK